MPTTEQVLTALRGVQDPDLHRDIVSLGFVKDLAVEGDRVRLRLELTTPACPVKDRLKEECERLVGALPGVRSVQVALSAEVRSTRPAGAVMPGVKHVVAVASGKGGVGKSTAAANIALALARDGAAVGLLDADIYGPSMPTMFGTTAKPQPAGGNRFHPVYAQGLKLMSIGFLVDPDQPMVWRGPMVHGALTQFLEQCEWGQLDYVIVDMPPGTGDAQLTLTQKAPLAGAVIVTTPQDVSLIDARKGLRMFEQVKVPVLGIVENMAFFVCDGCGKEHDIFRRGGGRRTAGELGVPFLGEVPIETAVPLSGDEGQPIVARAPESLAAQAFTRVAREIARQLAVRSMQPGDAADLSLSWEG
ncbi:MAG TPA: Mrp/NBP35 family ATP-binding protein [Planctomycetota bacterium]|nr:Mrp/NBP35 family ATP-binding protein [Planctomycetota bacterium]